MPGTAPALAAHKVLHRIAQSLGPVVRHELTGDELIGNGADMAAVAMAVDIEPVARKIGDRSDNARAQNPLSYKPLARPPWGESGGKGMQQDWKPRNRAERMRKRGWGEAQRGRLDRYHLLFALSMEAHAIREV